jgi:hypothetical protein
MKHIIIAIALVVAFAAPAFAETFSNSSSTYAGR